MTNSTNIEEQRQKALIDRVIRDTINARLMYAVTVTYENIEVTVTVDQKTNQTPLDLEWIKEIVSQYISTTDSTDFDSVINHIYYIVATRYPERDVEVMIYDNVECLSIMKIFKFNQPAI